VYDIRHFSEDDFIIAYLYCERMIPNTCDTDYAKKVLYETKLCKINIKYCSKLKDIGYDENQYFPKK
jgi:hypothetical protein